MRVQELFKFIQERHAIYTRRAVGQPKPWTQDKILQTYRFCNVRREDDKVTIWIRKNWREPHAEDPDLWFAMVVARMFNLPATLGVIGYPAPFRPEGLRKTVNDIQANHVTVYNGAYMIRCDCQAPGKTKVDYLVDKVFKPAWKEREALRPRLTDTLATFHARLMSCYGLGSFMAGQVIADTKFVGPLKNAADWWTWAAMGPGSSRGLNRVIGTPTNEPWGSQRMPWLTILNEIQTKIGPLTRAGGMPQISAQDLQNCLCEWDKYERARLGEGRPKQLYPGAG